MGNHLPDEQPAEEGDREYSGTTAEQPDSASRAESAEHPASAAGTEAGEPSRAERILRGLGYCGHYLHFHGGGRSGREPILCKLHRAGGSMSQLERTRDPRDRRALTVRLTEAGMQEAQRAIEARRSFREQAFSNLTDEEQDEFIALLEKIRNRWEELA